VAQSGSILHPISIIQLNSANLVAEFGKGVCQTDRFRWHTGYLSDLGRDATSQVFREGVEQLTMRDLRNARHLSVLETDHPADIQTLRAEHQKFLKTLEKLNADAKVHALRQENVDDFIAAMQTYAQREDGRLYQWADQLPEHSRRLMSSYLLGLRARLHNSGHTAI
jgi:hypothetical protein